LADRSVRPWDVVESTTILKNPWLTVRRDLCRTSRAQVLDYYVVEKPDYCMVVAVTPARQVVLVREYKHGAREIVRQLPAGYIHPGEPPAESAARELREETGFASPDLRYLGALHASPSAMQCRAHVFLARDAKQRHEQDLDPAEQIAVELMDLEELRRAVARNEVLGDVSSVAALFMACTALDSQEGR